uniref:Transketolaseic n=1 Tax=Rhizophora mucronata TaxID=61149 RepID=A0A2P2MSC3_RHIMU
MVVVSWKERQKLSKILINSKHRNLSGMEFNSNFNEHLNMSLHDLLVPNQWNNT